MEVGVGVFPRTPYMGGGANGSAMATRNGIRRGKPTHLRVIPAPSRPPHPKSAAQRPHAEFLRSLLVAQPRYRKGEHALDGWTWVHFASGLALGIVGLKWRWALALLIGFEAVEALLRRAKKDGEGLFEYESWKNVAADVAAGLLGYAVGRAER